MQYLTRLHTLFVFAQESHTLLHSCPPTHLPPGLPVQQELLLQVLGAVAIQVLGVALLQAQFIVSALPPTQLVAIQVLGVALLQAQFLVSALPGLPVQQELLLQVLGAVAIQVLSVALPQAQFIVSAVAFPQAHVFS